MNNIDQVYSVGEICRPTYPCKHNVSYFDRQQNKIFTILNGFQLKQLIEDGRWDADSHFIDHFKEYNLSAFGPDK